MRRGLILCGGVLLIAVMALSASASGYLRTANEIVRAGQNTFVICGRDGARSVTLDRDGNPVEPASTSCEHCADCSVVPIFRLPTVVPIGRKVVPDAPFANTFTNFARYTRCVPKLARGPPDMIAV